MGFANFFVLCYNKGHFNFACKGKAMRPRALKSNDPLPNINKILVIRVDGIGDLLNSTPAISLLRENYPSAEITVLARPLNAPVLIGNPDVDRTLIFERDGKHRGFKAQLQFYRELRRERFQLVVAMQTAMWSHLVAFLSGAPYRLGRYQKTVQIYPHACMAW